MSENKHTPGPWKVVPPGHGHPTEYLCVELDANEMYATVEMLPADARLIAAAPDLLEALKACELAMDTAALHGLPQELPPTYRDSWADAHIAARAAIAKAESA